jgi:hypothetical protein
LLVALIGGTLLSAGLRQPLTPEIRRLGIAAAALMAGSELAGGDRSRRFGARLAGVVLHGSLLAGWLLSSDGARHKRMGRRPSLEFPVARWDIAPGESLEGGRHDIVIEASMESFPASDPPAYNGAGRV